MAKVLTGIPSNGSWQSRTAENVYKVMQRAKKSGHAVGLSIADGSILPKNRNTLVQRAIDQDCDYLFFVDADIIMHADTLARLIAHDKDIIGLNYVTRARHVQFTATGLDDVEVLTNESSQGIQRVMFAATGAMLISVPMLVKMKANLLEQNPQPDYPWFNFAVGAQGRIIGEDNSFCYLANQMGFEVWIDHDLSKHVQHIAQLPLTYRSHGMDLSQL